MGEINRRYQYDALDRLTHISDSLRGQTDYRYDAAGQIVRATQSQNGKSQTKLFGYDSELNLNSIKTTPQVDSVIGIAEQKLHYDTAGRVIKTPHSTLSYDENGRLQQKTEDKDGFRPQQTRYHWDVYDRLIGVTLPDGERWHYRYDPFGRRVEKHRQDSDENHVYRWDGDNLIAHEIKLGKSERKTEWIYEPDSFRPLAQINQQGENGTPRLSYIITDHAGTVSELCDESGTVLWQGKQALWGGFSEKTDNNITCDLRYQGQIADKETGLYYNRHRYYDSDSCQYLSSDPIGLAGGIRPNSYVADPVNWVDPLGLAKSACPGDKSKIPKDLPKNIDEGKQGKHIKGHNNYIDGKSYFNEDINPQELLDGVHSGSYPIVSAGARGNPVVDFGKSIGVDARSNLSTRFGQIHYGKSGAHIVPHNPNLVK